MQPPAAGLFDQSESSKIVLGPAGIMDHPVERPNGEGVILAGIGNGNGPSVGVLEAVVAPLGSRLGEAVIQKRVNQEAGVHAPGDPHTVTTTAGDSTSSSAASGGMDFPSSSISSTMSLTAS